MPKFTIPDKEILAAALVGLEQQLAEVDGKIANLRQSLGKRGKAAKSAAGPAAAKEATGRRTMSAAARKRIGEAQKKRWASFRKGQRKTK